MQNYKETQIAGTKHTRCSKITVMNPYNDRQIVVFDEEVIHQLDDEQIKKSAGSMTIVVDHEKEVTHYETGEKMTYGDLYKWMASAYLQEALERDALASAAQGDDMEQNE